VGHALRQPRKRIRTRRPYAITAKAVNGAAQDVEGFVGAVVDVAWSGETRRMQELHY
jgi:hypothetical protein